MNTDPPSPRPNPSLGRLTNIAQARQRLMQEGRSLAPDWTAPWLERSWQRCLTSGLHPGQAISFSHVNASDLRYTLEANQQLIEAAQPMLHNLARAIVNTRYFAILTNADGVVVDACGAIDHTDPRAHLITRVGTDLSERSIGTTAIGAALAELQPVWLHRGEHFFEATSVYSCAGAPLFGPDGACVGMLDVTGVDVQERPELKHLVMQSASKIENALITALPHALMLRLNWPGNALGSDADGMLCLDPEGWITGANPVARQMVPGLAVPSQAPVHVSEVFGVPAEPLFDAAKRPANPIELPLWSGLRLQAQAITRADEAQTRQIGPGAPPARALREVEAAMIRQAVDDARGNVGQAARALGLSRATLYRKLGQKTT
ncbi:helix-turn-helix domain-containing protein [Rhodoferax sp.]|uniref:helix-turn-helix domain-containing protein n=1 Tax=Rhodoferax sp. TaxID=50421 RepID=UPI0008B8BE40|nr:helix-turn-helix domain-containing protein [Rhodoferax sp.]MDO8318821.1 helix-turn-helix domain-containing protein [Rhodoferax sp.]MDP2680413.1 helix-turn-helix domain-containing protein [Rhodoferax sp.]OGB53655.1 MAG: histidine kinase [Burkholderiales bacterium RIFOXYD12_FULL_59_19]